MMSAGLFLARWVHWSACLLLPGSLLFSLSIVGQNKLAGQANLWRDRFLRQLGQSEKAVWVFCAFSLLWWLVLAAWNMTGPDEPFRATSISAVVGQTRFGHLAILRLVILGLLGVTIFRRSGLRDGRLWLIVLAAILAMGNLMLLSLAGHAGASSGSFSVFVIFVDAIHLGAVAYWPIGLLYFALMARSAIGTNSSEVRSFFVQATRRFSVFSFGAVILLGTTGVINSCSFIRGLSDLWTTIYGQLLSAKIFLFLSMISIGACNLLVLRKRLDDPTADAQVTTMRKLLRNVLWESVLGFLILLLVALLGMTAPPVG